MRKKVLIILNPNAGMQKANKHFVSILDIFSQAGYETQVCLTQKEYNASDIVIEYSNSCDLIVCIGGDGTFNNTVNGIIKSNCDKPIGYIPAGSTNDFASGLKLDKDFEYAARSILNGKTIELDIGKFNDKYFSYVASCGLFTRVSYATQQDIKNMFGRLAYVFEGIRDLASLKPEYLRIETKDEVYEGEYIFSAICNATSVGGVLKLNQNLVDLSDGLFELLLIKMPKNLLELSEIVYALRQQNYSTKFLTFHPISEAKIICDKNISWTLDGEYMQGSNEINISTLNKAIKLIIPNGY